MQVQYFLRCARLRRLQRLQGGPKDVAEWGSQVQVLPAGHHGAATV